MARITYDQLKAFAQNNPDRYRELFPDDPAGAFAPEIPTMVVPGLGGQMVPEPTPEPEQPGLLGDLGSSLGIGAANIGRGVLEAVDYATPGDLGGTELAGRNLRDILGDVRSKYEAELSQATQESRRRITDAEGFFGTIGEALVNPRGTASIVAEQLPNLGVGFGVGGAAVKGAGLLAGARGLTAAGATRAATAGGMASEAVLEGGGAAAQAGDEIRRMGFDDLADNPEFNALLQQGVDPAVARETLAQRAASTAAPIAALGGAALGRLGATPAISRILTGTPGTGTTLTRAARTGLSEAGVEAGQEGLAQVASNVGLQRAGEETPTFEGVPESAALGAIMGGPMGAVAGAVSPGGQADATPPIDRFTRAQDDQGNEVFIAPNGAQFGSEEELAQAWANADQDKRVRWLKPQEEATGDRVQEQRAARVGAVQTDVSDADVIADLDKEIGRGLSAERGEDVAVQPGTYRLRALDDGALSTTAARLGKLFGREIVFFESTDPEADFFEGAVLRGGDGKRLYINAKTDNPLLAVTMHEMTHSIRRTDADLYGKLYDAVKQFDPKIQAHAEKRGNLKLNEDQRAEELIADIVADHGADPAFFDELQQRLDANTFQRLLQRIKQYLNVAKQKIKPFGSEQYVSDFDAIRENVLSFSEQAIRAERGRAEGVAQGATQQSTAAPVEEPPAAAPAEEPRATQTEPAEEFSPEADYGEQLVREAQAQREAIGTGIDEELDLTTPPPAPRERVTPEIPGYDAEAAAEAGAMFSQRRKSPMTGTYSQLDKVVAEQMGKAEPAKQVAAKVDGWVKKGKVKAEEVETTGLRDWLESREGRVTQQEVRDFIEQGGVQIEEVTKATGGKTLDQIARQMGYGGWTSSLTEDQQNEVIAEFDKQKIGPTDKPKYEAYQAPGGENYRELLLTLPAKQPKPDAAAINRAESNLNKFLEANDFTPPRDPEGRAEYERLVAEVDNARDATTNRERDPNYRSSHWDEPNVLAHIRFNDRTDANGKKVLFVEEIQSDWHQAGRKRGYKGSAKVDTTGWDATQEKGKWIITTGEGRVFVRDTATREEAIDDVARSIGDTGAVPDAPFKKTWPDLALKRVIKYAADNGYDRVAWAPGEVQADRYDLSKQVGMASLAKDRGKYTLYLEGKDGEALFRDTNGFSTNGQKTVADAAELEGLVGKDLAAKLIAGADAKDGEFFDVRGSGLKVGGEGMKAFYDREIPARVKKLAKKYGVEVTTEPMGAEQFKVMLPDGTEYEKRFNAQGPANAVAKRLGGTVEPAGMQAPGFDVTPALREQAQDEGFPLFSRRSQQANNPTNEFVDEQTSLDSSVLEPKTNKVFEKMRRGLLDSFSRLKDAETVLKKAGWEPTPGGSAYEAEMLMHGKTMDELQKFEKSYGDTISKIAKKAGLSLQQIGDYLYAKHAPERNKLIAERNRKSGKFKDGGSGMTNQEAREILDGFNAEQTAALDRIGGIVKVMNRQKLARLRKAGLISAETENELNSMFDNYVPLKTIDEETTPRTGMGFDLRGREYQEATGRGSRAENPLLVALQDAQRAIIRSNKAPVGQAFLKMARETQEIGGQKMFRELKKGEFPTKKRVSDDGQVTEMVDFSAIASDPRYLIVKENGERRVIEIADPVLARQMKKLGMAGLTFDNEIMTGLAQTLNRMTRTMSAMHTVFSLEFAGPNLVRDMQTAVFNSLGQEVPNRTALAAKIAKSLPTSMGGIIGQKLGRKDSKLSKLYEQFKADGAQTGTFGLEDIDSIAGKLQSRMESAISGTGAKRLAGKALDAVESFNEIFENTSRFAIYRAALDNGLNRQQAALLAKNVTVNFNKKGEATPLLNAAFMFFNAALQANAVMFRAAKNSRAVQGIAFALFLAGLAQADLEDDMKDPETGAPIGETASEYERDRSFIYYMPDGTRGEMPLAYGFNVPFAVGRRLARLFSGKENAAQAMGGITAAMMSSFMPIDSPIPSVIKPGLEVASNYSSFTGGPVFKDDPFSDTDPLSEQPWRSTNKALAAFTRYLNRASGGTKDVRGAIPEAMKAMGIEEYSSPAALEHLLRNYLGGIWGLTAIAAAGGKPYETLESGKPNLSKTFIARRFAGSKSDDFVRQQWFDLSDELENDVKKMKKARDLFAELPAERRTLVRKFANTDRIISRLKSRQRKIEKAGRDTTTIENMIRARQAAMLREWNETRP